MLQGNGTERSTRHPADSSCVVRMIARKADGVGGQRWVVRKKRAESHTSYDAIRRRRAGCYWPVHKQVAAYLSRAACYHAYHSYVAARTGRVNRHSTTYFSDYGNCDECSYYTDDSLRSLITCATFYGRYSCLIFKLVLITILRCDNRISILGHYVR